MIPKKVINPKRIRRIDGGFSFIPHRFLTGGFLETLNQREILLYFFLILASDRHGMSIYSGESHGFRNPGSTEFFMKLKNAETSA